MNGWVKLHRQMSENALWLSEPFTRGQAWVDMLMMANHSEGFVRVRGVKVRVGRGQLGWSEKRLAERWQWSRGKVRRFLNELETVQQIVQQKDNVTSLLTIVKYDTYQSDGTADSTANGTANGHQTDTNKNDKKKKKEREQRKALLNPAKESAAESPSLSPPKPRPRNENFDALANATGSDPAQMTRTAARACGVALAEIKAACPSLTPAEIERRATNYESQFEGASITPSALAKHWALCDNPRAKAVNGQPQLSFREADELRREERAREETRKFWADARAAQA